MKHLIANRS